MILFRYWHNGVSAIEMSGKDDGGGADQLRMNMEDILERLLFCFRIFFERGWIAREALVDWGRVLIQIERSHVAAEPVYRVSTVIILRKSRNILRALPGEIVVYGEGGGARVLVHVLSGAQQTIFRD